MPTHPSNLIVVGVDGSAASGAALRWAAHHAALRHADLRVVHALPTPPAATGLGPPPPEFDLRLRADADRVLADALGEAGAAAPTTPVSGAVVAGTPAQVLRAESRHAALLVVGHRGLGGFTGLLVGSVGVQLAAHALCPLVVVRPPAATPGRSAGRVVVGVDGSPRCEPAIAYAFQEASWRDTGLTAVHAWTGPVPAGPGDILPLVYDVEEVAGEETRLLAEAIAGWRDKYPDVDVRETAIRGGAAHAVITESAGAALLVLGSRGRGGFRGLLLGSVSQAALHHAGSPVAIVRG